MPTPTRLLWEALGHGGRPVHADTNTTSLGSTRPRRQTCSCRHQHDFSGKHSATEADLFMATPTRLLWEALGHGGRPVHADTNTTSLGSTRPRRQTCSCRHQHDFSGKHSATEADLFMPTPTRLLWEALGHGGRPVHADTNTTSLGSIQPRRQTCSCRHQHDFSGKHSATEVDLFMPTPTRLLWEALGHGGRPVHADTNTTSLGSIRPRRQTCSWRHQHDFSGKHSATEVDLFMPTPTRLLWEALGHGGRPVHADTNTTSLGSTRPRRQTCSWRHQHDFSGKHSATEADLFMPTPTRLLWEALGHGGRPVLFMPTPTRLLWEALGHGGRPVHADTNTTSLGSIRPRRQTCSWRHQHDFSGKHSATEADLFMPTPTRLLWEALGHGGRPVHADTNTTSLGSIRPRRQICSCRHQHDFYGKYSATETDLFMPTPTRLLWEALGHGGRPVHADTNTTSMGSTRPRRQTCSCRHQHDFSGKHSATLQLLRKD